MRERLKDLAEARVRYGTQRRHVLLLREGWEINHKRTYRLYSEEGLSIGSRTPSRRRACRYRSGPAEAGSANDPEFAGRLLDQWAYLNKVELDLSLPGKPSDNAYKETSNSRLRQECLNASWFLPMVDARARIEEWRNDDNHKRPPRPSAA